MSITIEPSCSEEAQADLFDIEVSVITSFAKKSNEEIHSLAKHNEHLGFDKSLGLQVYPSFLLSIRARSANYLRKALEEIEGLVARLGLHHTDTNRRFGAMKILATWMSQNENTFDDVTLHIYESLLYAAHQDHRYSDELLDNLRNCLRGRIERHKSKDDQDRIIELTELTLDATPHHRSLRRALLLDELADHLHRRFKLTKLKANLDRAISAADMAADVAPPSSYRLVILRSLGNHLRSRFELSGCIDDLDRAVEIHQMVADETPHDHTDRPGRLNNLGTVLYSRFERIGTLDDLERAVETAEIATAVTMQGSLDWAMRMDVLGNYLSKRSDETGSINDLNRAVEAAHMAVGATPPDHPDIAALLNNLGNHLLTRFGRLGLLDDLDKAIYFANIVVNATLQTDPDWASRLNNLSNSLGKRYERTGSIDDLNRAVSLATLAVENSPLDYPNRAILLNTLGNQLGYQFERTGSVVALDRAVEVANMAVLAGSGLHPYRSFFLSTLSNQLGSLFESTGSLCDLDRAIEMASLAVDATPHNSEYQAGHLNNLGSRLVNRFERTGSMNDLNRAIETLNMAVDSTAQDHPNRASWLNSLGISLIRRSDWTGSANDLDRAIEVADLAVDATPVDHPDRPGWLNSLGNHLNSRFRRVGLIDDLNRAIEVTEVAVEATPGKDTNWPGRLNNLGRHLSTRYKKTGSYDDLSYAIRVSQRAVDATPEDHPGRPGRLTNLGNYYGMQYERGRLMIDFDRAIEIVGKAVDITPLDHPDRAERLRNLGNLLGSCFERTESKDDLDHRLSLYVDGWKCLNAPPSQRIQAAQKAASILASQSKWVESTILLQEAVDVLPTVSPRSLHNTDKQHMLEDFAGLASMAVATALNAVEEPYRALQILEKGRGIISGLLMEMRGDISDLKQRHPTFANEFVTLRDLLDSPNSITSLPDSNSASISQKHQTDQRYEADQKFRELIRRIRAQPGFQNFLLPPTVEDLKTAANPDPIIVINLSPLRCDAFLVEYNLIRVLRLPGLELREVQKQVHRLKRSHLSALTPLLSYLWDRICEPCLEALGYEKPILNDDWPHVWWVPTGLLSQLPLHAAGYHAQGSTRAVIDRVMSSYTSSIKALIHGRRFHIHSQTDFPQQQALLVAMLDTPGLSTNAFLPFVESEVEIFRGLCSSLQMNLVTPEPRKNDVLKHLAASSVFHFAGHGRSDPVDPSRSCLLLEDWQTDPLTVEDLLSHSLQKNPPFLGYLSACSTGSNEAEQLLDEGIHLINALQLAGFRHVVGTLWEVSDRYCVDVARVLYETICKEGLTDLAVCRGLHRAIRALRASQSAAQKPQRTFKLALPEAQSGGFTNHYWVPYVHFGN